MVAQMDGVIQGSVAERIHNMPIETLFSWDQKSREHAFETYTKVLVVRNPISRLLSCYRDKFLPKSNKLPAFNKILVDLKLSGKLENNSLDFGSFVRLLVSGTLDEFSDGHTEPRHWVPQSELCYPCEINYQHVLKVESLQEEVRWLFREVGVPKTVQLLNENSMNDGDNHSEIVELSAAISQTHLQTLYEYYKDDFHVFDYT